MPKIESRNYEIYFYTFLLSIITYGFSLSNYSLTIDNEIPIFSDFGLDLGRWGQNLIRYHIFKGHLPYFSLLLSLFLFSLSAVRLSQIFKFKGINSYYFCALFITFPQLSYQVVFQMMSDIAGLGVLLSVIVVELYIKSSKIQFSTKKGIQLFCIALISMFTISMYQAFILVPCTIYIILFFQSSFEETFNLISELKKMMYFILLILFSLLLYVISVKLICPATQNSSYLNSFISGDGSNKNQFLEFLSIWFKNLIGDFYYGEKSFILVLILSLYLFGLFFFEKKHIIVRLTSLFIIIISPFLMSVIITNGYHPPRLYLTSNLVFAFVIVFGISIINSSNNITKIAVIILTFTNIYFVTNLFYSANKIYKRDKKIADKIDNIIQTKYPKFLTTEKYIYFYGFFPFQYHQDIMLDKSEIFGGSIYTWDNGNNYRIINFFREADVADYKMVDTKEKFNLIKDSISKMPVWPDSESVRMFNNIVVVKLGQNKGSFPNFE